MLTHQNTKTMPLLPIELSRLLEKTKGEKLNEGKHRERNRERERERAEERGRKRIENGKWIATRSESVKSSSFRLKPQD